VVLKDGAKLYIYIYREREREKVDDAKA